MSLNTLNLKFSGLSNPPHVTAAVSYIFDESEGPSGIYRPVTADDYSAGGGGGGGGDVTAYPPAASVASGASGPLTANGTIFSANFRRQLFVQNIGVNPIYLALSGTASPTNYHMILPGGAISGDGTGGNWSADNWYGAVSVSGSGISYTKFEF